MPKTARHVVVAASLALSAALGAAASAADSLTVVSWGGSYARASKAAVLDPFSAEYGVDVQLTDYNGGLAQIRAQVENGNVYWDVVDLEMDDFERGCDEGLLELVSVTSLVPAADGTPAQDDYFPTAITECGVGQLYGATIYAYRSDSFAGDQPTTVADFFDLQKFPGRRGMRRVARDNLEYALMADGVHHADIYDVLDTPEGVDRAFRKLDTIKDSVVWWDTGAQPPQMLADKEVALTTAYNGRIFNAQIVEKQPLVVVWDGALLDAAGFGIVAGAPNLAAARQLVAFAARPQIMANITKYISYSPARRSALPLVTTHLATGVEMAPHLPTGTDNIAKALQQDRRWWSDRGDEMSERFGAWLAQ